MLSETHEITDVRNELETYNVYGFENDTLYGYQTTTLSPYVSSQASGLTAATQYYFKINTVEYDITTVTDVLFSDIILLMNTALSATNYFVSFIEERNQLKVTNQIEGTNSAIALTAGSTGTDLFATLNGWVEFNTAVTGQLREDNMEWAIIDAIDTAKLRYMWPIIGETTYTTVKALDKTSLTTTYNYVYRAEVLFSAGMFLEKIANAEKQKMKTIVKDTRTAIEPTGKKMAGVEFIREGKRYLDLGGWDVTTRLIRSYGLYE